MREKTCLVIGGGRGMGAATAREMHKRGYRLSLMSPSESCEQLAKDLKAVALRGKAENKENLKSIVSFTMEKYGRIDSVLVHVGGPPKGDLLEIDDEDWDKAIYRICYVYVYLFVHVYFNVHVHPDQYLLGDPRHFLHVCCIFDLFFVSFWIFCRMEIVDMVI